MAGWGKCILITGTGHSATRMLVHMLARHSQVAVPTSSLNYVQEFYPMHRLFIDYMDATPLHAKDCSINVEELRFLLDAYMGAIDTTKPYFVLKLPYHPLTCLDIFVDYFKGNLILANAKRPVEKIIQSFVRRGEDQHFFDDPVEHLRQVKKLDPQRRGYYLTHKDPANFFREVDRFVDAKVQEWQSRYPDMPCVQIDVEQVALSRDYLVELLGRLGLSTGDADRMLEVVDRSRLLDGKQAATNKPRSRFRRILERLTSFA